MAGIYELVGHGGASRLAVADENVTCKVLQLRLEPGELDLWAASPSAFAPLGRSAASKSSSTSWSPDPGARFLPRSPPPLADLRHCFVKP